MQGWYMVMKEKWNIQDRFWEQIFGEKGNGCSATEREKQDSSLISSLWLE